MAQVRAVAEQSVAASSKQAFRAISDYHGRVKWLPPAFSNYHVEEGGEGGGTVITYHLSTGRRERDYRMRVTEPARGRELVESDTLSSLVTRWAVSPQGSGSTVRIETTWQGAAGIGGFFERTFASRVLQKLYRDELSRLDTHLVAVGKREHPTTRSNQP